MKNLLIAILLFLTNRSGKSLRYKDIFAMKQVILFYSTICAGLLLAIEPVRNIFRLNTSVLAWYTYWKKARRYLVLFHFQKWTQKHQMQPTYHQHLFVLISYHYFHLLHWNIYFFKNNNITDSFSCKNVFIDLIRSNQGTIIYNIVEASAWEVAHRNVHETRGFTF